MDARDHALFLLQGFEQAGMSRREQVECIVASFKVGRCAACRWWVQATLGPPRDDGYRDCVMANQLDAPIDIETDHCYGHLRTAPTFGCVRWEPIPTSGTPPDQDTA